MKKLLLSLVVMLALAVIAPVFAGEEEKAEFHGFGDDLELEHLYLYQKDHANDWEVVEKGASGKLHYTPFGSEFKFVFNGHKMDPGTDYTLIYYPDPWPGRIYLRRCGRH